ncbi:MAG: peptidoglycan-binding protein [Firmicutes bacterium]|nr:peptidoglycan-binding protein [Bacillota bacterium]
MGLGYLKVQVHTGDDALPIENANVLIRDTSGRVLYNLTTDSSGNTDRVELYAPDKSHTLDPNDTGPYYGMYDVEVSKPKFIREVIKGVQIFDGIDSVLPVNMLPNPYPGQELVSVNVIPENLLHSSEPRNQEGPPSIPEAAYTRQSRGIASYKGIYYTSGPRVLPAVIVPDYITVHLGTPSNTGARNVRVKFIDYVKNVASSEIYPTWPNNSLIANIHAIVTFALNRIYTEWYRSRGQNFDITNSTAYDMAFTENRNIFQNISNIVDDVFNVYAKRIGFKDPYFTEFCNGTTAKCNGMSQWGTVTFANQGLNPLQILRAYYPRDLELIRTNNVGPVQESYPGAPLSQGSSGDSVRKMQNYLNRIRVNYPAIPQITNPNGVFGADTANAVRMFQRTFNLPQDGVIGRGTWYKIVQIFVGVTKLAELTSEGQRIGIGEIAPTSTIREGSKGPDVTQLQFILNFLSQFFNDIPSVIQDSVFGRSTRDAVIAFQRKFGLPQDGIVGPATWKLLYQVYKNTENNIAPVLPPQPPITPPTSPAYPGTPLRVGSRGNNVAVMQSYLNRISSKYPSIPRLAEDGIFGAGTQSAVIAFQRIFGLTPDGVIGPITWNRIIEVANSIGAGLSPTTPPAYPGAPLRVGSRGNNVLVLQENLNKVASRYPVIPRLTVDGVFGPLTQNSVIQFQRLFGFTPDGVVGPATWDKIMSLAF